MQPRIPRHQLFASIDGSIKDLVVWGTLPEDLNADGIPEGWRGRARNQDDNNDNMGSLTTRAVVVCSSP